MNNTVMVEQLDNRFEMEMFVVGAMAMEGTVSAEQAEAASCCENYTCTFSPSIPSN
ncbi:hypothetical protein [Cognatiluteimonas telluris]|jgi:hypothetical protein|uniref:hypothetical protein n=1 Tax=Cognatiluteimonas telluris TaxID=1104775 RepID=UPI00140C19A1|nr:hypothetical protein [Lysobacter telluris]